MAQSFSTTFLGGGGYIYDWSACTRLALVNPDLVASGTKMVIPANVVQFLAYRSTVTKSEDGTTFTLSAPTAKNPFYGDFELNGTMNIPANGDFLVDNYYGALTGSGNIILNGFGRGIGLWGLCDFDGTVTFGIAQQGQNLFVYSSSLTSQVGKVITGNYGDPGIQPQYICFDPQLESGAEPATLVISELSAAIEQGNALSTTPGTYRRRGTQLIVCSNNTIRVSSITGTSCPIGLIAARRGGAGYQVGNPPSFDKGLGNVVLGDHGNRLNYYYVSPMMNVTLAGMHGAYATTTLVFDYRAESNVVNQAEILDLTKMSGCWPNPNVVQIYGFSPANLPHSIRLRAREGERQEASIPLNITDDEWTMPFDFGAADVNSARCETNCKLSIPSSGTVYVTNATTAVDAAYPTEWTEYPVLTTYAGGAPTNDAGESVFNDWEIKFLGKWGKVKVEKVVKDTGLYLRMRQERGFKLIIR